MALDASIYNLLGRGVKSVNDYDTEAATLAGLKQRNLLGQIDVENAQQGQADDRGFRAAAAQFGDDPMANYRASLKVAPKQAAGYLKSALDGQKAQADITESGAKTGHLNAQTGEIQFKQQLERRQQHLAQLDSVTDIPSAHAWLQDAVKSGELPFDRAAMAAANLQTNPASLEDWKAKAKMGGLTLIQQMEQQRHQQDFGLKNANEIMTKGPDGSFGVNQPLVAAKAHVAKSGASNVSVKVDNALGEGVAKQVGPMVESSYNAANGAQASLANADAIISAIDSGKVIAGPGAELRLKGAQVADMLGIGGKDTKEKIANTRSTIQGLNQSILTARAQLKGQGQVSDYEGKLLAKATAGDLEDLTPAEIRQLAVLNKKLSGQVISQHNQLITKLKGHAPTQPIADLFETNPGNATAPAPAGKVVDFGSLK